MQSAELWLHAVTLQFKSKHTQSISSQTPYVDFVIFEALSHSLCEE